MTTTPTALVSDFIGALLQATSDLVGSKTVWASIAKRFPEITANPDGTFQGIDRLDTEAQRRFVASTARDLTASFGYEFAEQSLSRVYATLKQKTGDESALAAVLKLVPDGFLEQEKVQHLTKAELEARVLERTKELQRLNTNLEATVAQRTKELLGANMRLTSANTELERLSNAKTEFLSLVSHQLLIPLSAAKWGLEALAETPAPREDTEVATLITGLISNNDRMSQMVQNLLNIARIEEGRLTYTFTKVSLGDLVAEVLEALANTAKAKSIAFVYQPPPAPIFIQADKEKFFLAVENVVANAVKYTAAHTSVAVTLTTKDNAAILSIRDEGIGIPPEAQKHIFSKFFRAENAQKIDASGSGLGLFIVKRIVEDHRARVYFKENEAGRGTTFVIEAALTS
ncbi:MAG: HAMP domain-containing sensor histidine kinase [bacterium]|nr:HAMP domain-containing sensor histidine kinase [bacterium]